MSDNRIITGWLKDVPYRYVTVLVRRRTPALYRDVRAAATGGAALLQLDKSKERCQQYVRRKTLVTRTPSVANHQGLPRHWFPPLAIGSFEFSTWSHRQSSHAACHSVHDSKSLVLDRVSSIVHETGNHSVYSRSQLMPHQCAGTQQTIDQKVVATNSINIFQYFSDLARLRRHRHRHMS